jgi:hypothetical protein
VSGNTPAEILMRESLGEIRMPSGFPSHFMEEAEGEIVQHTNNSMVGLPVVGDEEHKMGADASHLYMMHDLQGMNSAEELLAAQASSEIIDDSDEKIPSLGHDDPHSKDDDANSSGSGSGALGSDEHLELDYHFNTP